MCHSTVFWYVCEHLVLSDITCPFKETLGKNTKSETNIAFTEDVCCLCKQPSSPTIDSLKANQLSCQKLAAAFSMEASDSRFPEMVTSFFSGEYLPAAPVQDSFSATVSRAGDGRSCAPKARCPTMQAKQSPAMSKARSATVQGKPPPSASQVKQSAFTSQTTASSPNQSKSKPQANQHSTSKPMPSDPNLVSKLSPEDLLLVEALDQWERERSDPNSDFPNVNFGDIKYLYELEEDLVGPLPGGSQSNRSAQAKHSFQTQHETQQQPEHGLPLQHQQGTPYDGTNWGQERVYLPAENYYFAGYKAHPPSVKEQMSSPLPAMDTTLMDVDEKKLFRAYTKIGPEAQSTTTAHQSQNQQSPIMHLSPMEIHQLSTTPSKSKGKATMKAKATATPTVTIIDGYTTEHDSNANTTKRTKTAVVAAAAAAAAVTKDPTRGIKDPTSRVTKPTSSSSPLPRKRSSKANTKNPTVAAEPSSRRKLVSIPRPPPEALIEPRLAYNYTMPAMMLPCY